MTDQPTNTTRIFKVGGITITEDASTAGKPVKAIQQLLAPLYPQVEHATIRERTDGDTTIIEFIAKPGRKG